LDTEGKEKSPRTLREKEKGEKKGERKRSFLMALIQTPAGGEKREEGGGGSGRYAQRNPIAGEKRKRGKKRLFLQISRLTAKLSLKKKGRGLNLPFLGMEVGEKDTRHEF